jgi:hypothetical protein
MINVDDGSGYFAEEEDDPLRLLPWRTIPRGNF